MKKYALIISIIIVANSCYLTNNFLTDKKINQKLVTESDEVKVTTFVEKYSTSKEWYYGKIEIENKTTRNFKFNFNQKLVLEGDTLIADWNIYPISYAHQAFELVSKTTKNWTVVWRMEKDKFNKKAIIKIIPDLTMIEFNQ
jgi:hypothetical protein